MHPGRQHTRANYCTVAKFALNICCVPLFFFGPELCPGPVDTVAGHAGGETVLDLLSVRHQSRWQDNARRNDGHRDGHLRADGCPGRRWNG